LASFERRKTSIIKCIEYIDSEYRCSKCGQTFEWWALEFHHKNKVDKEFGMATSYRGGNFDRSWEEIASELDNCVLLCRNCHRIITYPDAVVGVDDRMDRKLELMNHLGGRCAECGLSPADVGDNLSVFDFHHRDPEEKSFTVGPYLRGTALSTLYAEADKCTLLCAVCHSRKKVKQ
jgi:hypothetical protein